MKLIIEISDNLYNVIKLDEYGLHKGKMYDIIRDGIPLANDSEKAEVQAYFAGEAYGWEQGRKALIEDVKARIEKQVERDFAFGKTETLKVPCHYGIANGLQNAILILDNIDKTESENKYGNSTK